MVRVRDRLTLTMAVDCLRGSSSKEVQKKRLHELVGIFGALKDIKKTDIERMLKQMIQHGQLCESHERNPNFGGVNSYLQLGRHAQALERGTAKLLVPFAAARAQGDSSGLTTSNGNKPISEQRQTDSFFEGETPSDAEAAAHVQLLQKAQSLAAEFEQLKRTIWDSTGRKSAIYHIWKETDSLALIRALPCCNEQLQQVNGFGLQKVKKYGPQIFAKVADMVSRFPELQPLFAKRQAQKAALQLQKTQLPQVAIATGRAPPTARRPMPAKQDGVQARLAAQTTQPAHQDEDFDNDFAPLRQQQQQLQQLQGGSSNGCSCGVNSLIAGSSAMTSRYFEESGWKRKKTTTQSNVAAGLGANVAHAIVDGMDTLGWCGLPPWVYCI